MFILLPLALPETAWADLAPLHSRDFQDTSPYHIHTTGPAPLGYEAGQIQMLHPSVDFKDSQDAADAIAQQGADRADMAMEVLAWVVAAAILGALALPLVWWLL